MFEPRDLQQLKEIARRSHIESRFYFDGRFPMARCNELFELWIERSCLGWADAVFVGLQTKSRWDTSLAICNRVGAAN